MIVAERIVHVPRPARVTAFAAARLGTAVIDRATVHEVLDRYGLHQTGASHNLRLARRSRNIVVTTDAGKKVIKLYRPQWTSSTVRYVHSILGRLEDLQFPAPRLERTSAGASWTEIGGEVFGVFDFLPGTNYSLHFLRRGDRLHLTSLSGTTLARLHRQLEGFLPEGSHHLGFDSYTGPRKRDITWLTTKLDELTTKSKQLQSKSFNALTDRLIARAGELGDSIERLDRGLGEADFPRLIIHGDYGLHNLLFESRDRAIPVDYELSRLDWRLNDLISALVKYRYTGGYYDLESMEAFIRAYASEFPLSSVERQQLPAAWRFYKLQAAVQYWNSFFETAGPIRKLESALDAIDQSRWVEENPNLIRNLSRAAGETDTAARTLGRLPPRPVERRSNAELTVMQVTPDLEVGGAQETVRTVAKYLPRAGCHTLVCTFKDGPLKTELERAGVVVEQLPNRRYGLLTGPLFLTEMILRRRDLMRLIDKHRVDVVQTQGLGTLDFLIMTLRFGREVQVWWTIQNSRFMLRQEHLSSFKWLLRPKRAAHRLLYRLGSRIVDGIIAVSNETERSFRETIGLAQNRIQVVFNAVDVERYPAVINRADVRRGLGFQPTDHIMTMVGTFKRQKGHRYLINAVASVSGRNPHLRLVLVGDGELSANIQAMACRVGIKERVHFIGTRRDVPALLAASDSFVLPSLWEGLPVALIEAMATGLPTVATNVSGTSQVMIDGKTGWLVPPADAAALEAAIRQLLADPARARRMGEAARERVTSIFSARAQAEHLAALFRTRNGLHV